MRGELSADAVSARLRRAGIQESRVVRATPRDWVEAAARGRLSPEPERRTDGFRLAAARGGKFEVTWQGAGQDYWLGRCEAALRDLDVAWDRRRGRLDVRGSPDETETLGETR